jgi:hypothetical protein
VRLLLIVVAVLVAATPAHAMRWLDDPGHVITGPDSQTIPATGPSTEYAYPATVSPADEPVLCSPTSFPVGTSEVTCTADDASDAHFSLTVQDIAAPSITPPPADINDSTADSGKNESFSYSASDNVDGTVPVSCTPTPGSAFPIGTTPVNCTATDSSGNQAAISFNVHISDAGAPTISIVAPPAAEAAGPGGAVVTYTVTMGDNSGNTPALDCGGHDPGSLFPIGTTLVTCKATDGAGNSTSAAPFNVVVRDSTPPTLTLPTAITVEADSGAGKVVSFPSSANDLVAGAVPVTCAPPSGSTFPITSTTVNCSATDGTNSATGSFTVTVTDASGPTFTSVPGTLTVEANGPSGSIVNYTAPSAVDTVDGPQLVSCAPATHTLFPIGATTVHCGASDNHGNSSSASFQVAVVDTTPPTLAVPGPTSVYATTPTGIPETAQGLIGFRAAVIADDIVDPHPFITDNLGSFVEVGIHDVIFGAHDASGNVRYKQTQLTVLPEQPAGTAPLPVPPPAKLPADVPSLQLFPGDGFVRLVWGAVPGAARYLVYRSVSGTRQLAADGHGDLVYSGTATTYTDRGLTNGVEYRYVVVSQDAAGNQSAGVGSPAVPRLNLLRTPKDGAKVKKPPKLTWARNAEANYYNVQLFRGQAKILSSWPVRASLKLKRTWKYQGRRYTLTKGVYRWYVWPGFGARSAVDYGELLGSNSFQMTR